MTFRFSNYNWLSTWFATLSGDIRTFFFQKRDHVHFPVSSSAEAMGISPTCIQLNTFYRIWYKNLIKKYGEPDESNEHWLNDLYQDDYQEWGVPVSIGHLVYFTTWNTDGTSICLALTGENYEISLNIEYSSIEFSYLEEQRNEARIMEDLWYNKNSISCKLISSLGNW